MLFQSNFRKGGKFKRENKRKRADNKPLVLASLNPSYPVYDIYDKNHVLVGAVGYSTYEHMKVIEIPCRLFTLHFG